MVAVGGGHERLTQAAGEGAVEQYQVHTAGTQALQPLRGGLGASGVVAVPKGVDHHLGD